MWDQIVICVLYQHDVNKPQRIKLHHKLSPYKYSYKWAKKHNHRRKAKNLLS